jgi:hypothetical protein
LSGGVQYAHTFCLLLPEHVLIYGGDSLHFRKSPDAALVENSLT